MEAFWLVAILACWHCLRKFRAHRRDAENAEKEGDQTECERRNVRVSQRKSSDVSHLVLSLLGVLCASAVNNPG